MKYGDWKLIVIYADGGRDAFYYDSEKEADNAAEGMRMALGEQINWCGVMPVWVRI